MTEYPALSSAWPQVAGPAASQPGGRANTEAASGDREKIAQLAHEFEAYFILQLVRQMRQSMLDDENGQGLGAGTMTDTLDVELGRQLADAGGIGLGPILQTAMARQVAGVRTTAPAEVGVTAIPLPVRAGQPVAVSAVAGDALAANARPEFAASGDLSSSYGWRTDPFTHEPRFHTGIDIRAAYGREVPAAGAGAVVYSGAQGGYGNTVVVEHPGGVRTRYAHLSSIQVEVGARVEAGTVLGRVGSSGRSTGPHLHFEVLQDGHPVDPEVAATRYAGQLKLGAAVAD